jgi:mannose-1-phosphate guanylyltransferase
MVPVLNMPFLEHVLRHLNQHQVRQVILAQGHLAPAIESYFKNGRHLGVELSYVVEDAPRGTAGAAKNADKYIDGTFLVLNGDIFTGLDISSMVNFHRQKEAKITIACTPVEDPSAYGLIETSSDGRITRFLEKPKKEEITTNLINAGTYILEPEVLAHIPPQTTFSFEREVFPALLQTGWSVYAYPSDAYWIDIGTPAKYLKLNQDMLIGKNNAARFGFATGNEVRIGNNTKLHHTARITGPVLIGENCSIGPGVNIKGPTAIGDNNIIGEESSIEESLIWWNTYIGERVQLKKSIVANGSRFEGDNVIENAVIGDNATTKFGASVKAGEKVWSGAIVEPEAEP